MWYNRNRWKYEEGEGAIKAILKMYHTFKKKNIEIKLPKGWQFSGDPSLLNLSNSDFNVYFMIVNTRVRADMRSGILLEEKKNEWEIEEHHGQTGVTIRHGQKLTNKEAKEIAVKRAKNLNKERFMGKLKWVVVTAILAGLVSFISSKL